MAISTSALPSVPSPAEPVTILLRVRGVVQGVGFRPFIYRLSQRFELSGWVRNDAEGVLIEAAATPDVLEAFARAIAEEAPPAAQVESIEEISRTPGAQGGDFIIAESEKSQGITTLISPDLALCEDCLRELRDPEDRRYRYPFINCTNCGPRYSIIEALPYDRPLTTMKIFPMCASCAGEYGDPLDRRFHAQPTACPECGPTILYLDAHGNELSRGGAAVNFAARSLREGKILAIKGLGGYHLACDARNEEAVMALRERKFRKEKPFALMARSLEVLEDYVNLDDKARALLESVARPIVLLSKGTQPLPDGLAPENAELGVMLSYTPLQFLLFDAGAPELLVMTSANRSSEPIAYRDEEALSRLAGLADAFLIGERPIERRVDDSVVALRGGEPVIFRRARGYAPAPVLSWARFKGSILGLGAGLKNAITLVTGGYAFVSQHLGDLDNLEAYEAFKETIADLTEMYDVDLTNTLVVHDLHPDYASSRYAGLLPGPKLAVPHHQAHIASVLAERDMWDTNVVGFSFDGAGLGEDGTIWGGEVFHGSLGSGFKRVAHLRAAPLPGGDAAARIPAQAAVGFLSELDPSRYERYLPEAPITVARSLIQSGLNVPLTSSMGRLFDTVSALTGFHRKMSFEGQAAMRLEALARTAGPQSPYPFPFDGRTWDYRPLLEAVLEELDRGVEVATIARRFHEAVATGVVEAARFFSCPVVVLSGGVWQNALLHHLEVEGLREAGFSVWWNRQVPAGDGGISLGQVALAAREA
jgi:hydrogenase maturation protein HypF